MAKLINGNGNPAVYAKQDASFYEGFVGSTTSILDTGDKFEYEIPDANTLRVKDGVILTKEGRRIQLDVDQVDEFEIPTGTQGEIAYYIVGYRLYVDSTDSSENCETFVQVMPNATATIAESTLKSGATEVFVSLYRIKQTGLLFEVLDLLLPYEKRIQDITLAENKIEWNFIPGPIVTSWSENPSQIDGVAYYTATITLTQAYSDYLEIALAPNINETLPSSNESKAFDKIKYTKWNSENKTLTFYAEEVPSDQFYLYVKGGE